MRCTDPRTVGFRTDGKTISWSPKNSSREFASFKLPCGQCLQCRLEYARQAAIRCMHEASLHEKNAFVTLTYADEHLKSEKLQYRDFQLFTKRLRKKIFEDFLEEHQITSMQFNALDKDLRKDLFEPYKIGLFVTGEYGDEKKRPHWHFLVFNWSPSDPKSHYTTELGHPVFTSETLKKLWPLGNSEFGSVTFESAGYCARYAAKKLIHGSDDDHDYHPIHKRSSHSAIGKRWIEKYWKRTFEDGYIILRRKNQKPIKCSIPRYYEKWLKKHQPLAWERYVTQIREDQMQKATARERDLLLRETAIDVSRGLRGAAVKQRDATKRILSQKFKQLQKRLKL